MTLTPKEIVKKLDEYVIGQDEAKRIIAIALRNRERRMLLPQAFQDEVIPKNILMIGTTGVGKTEIARRLSKMFGYPFIKVEASKYTEVGFVGRDVESMIRDLALASLALVRKEFEEKHKDEIEKYIEDKILDQLLPKLPKGASPEKLEDYERALEKMKTKLHKGELDKLKIEIEISESKLESNPNLAPEMENMQENLIKVIGLGNKKTKKNIFIKDAKNALRAEASEKTLDNEAIKSEAHFRVENQGIIFIDELDKVAVSSKNSSRQDPSKEGVQRDLLPIVEGSNVNTKIGQIKTDHILFIAAGAFHLAKPSDLIPELQGRFPLRVELSSLDAELLYEILTKPKNSLLKQYIELLKTEEITLKFEDEAIKELANLTAIANEKVEDIGARRLHAVLEKVLEDISFNCDDYAKQEVIISKEMVKNKLENIVHDEDIARYIL